MARREQRIHDRFKLHNDKNKNRVNQRRNVLRWPLNSPTSVLLLDMLSAASFSSSFYVSLLAIAQVATADDFGTFIFVSFFFFFLQVSNWHEFLFFSHVVSLASAVNEYTLKLALRKREEVKEEDEEDI